MTLCTATLDAHRASQPSRWRARARPVAPRGPRRGLGVGELRLDGGFWGAPPGDVNAAATLAALPRLDGAARLARELRPCRRRRATGGERPGWQFSDSEVYKLLEAMAWELRPHGRPGSSTRLLDSAGGPGGRRAGRRRLPEHLLRPRRAGRTGTPTSRWATSCTTRVTCCRPLSRACAPSARTTLWCDVARRAADHVCRRVRRTAGRGRHLRAPRDRGRRSPSSGRALGEPRYIEQARLFVERRGHGTLAGRRCSAAEYFQDDVPVRDADVWRGHAVRALYLSAGAVDVAVDDRGRRPARRRRAAVGRARSSAAPTSPAAWARGTRTRASATTGSCRPTAPTARRAPGVASIMVSLAPATSPPARCATPTSSSAPSTTWSPRRRATTDARSSTPTRCTSASPARTCGPTASTRAPRAASGRRGSTSRAARRTSPAPSPRWPAYVAAVDGRRGIALLQYAGGRVRARRLRPRRRDALSRRRDRASRRGRGPWSEAGVRLRIPAWATDAAFPSPEAEPPRSPRLGRRPTHVRARRRDRPRSPHPPPLHLFRPARRRRPRHGRGRARPARALSRIDRSRRGRASRVGVRRHIRATRRIG